MTTLRRAYDQAVAEHLVAPMLHHEFWVQVGRAVGRSASGARHAAVRAGWPTTCDELGLGKRPKGRPAKPPRAKTPHVKTVCARLRSLLHLLAKHPAELADIERVIAQLEAK